MVTLKVQRIRKVFAVFIEKEQIPAAKKGEFMLKKVKDKLIKKLESQASCACDDVKDEKKEKSPKPCCGSGECC